MTTQSYDSQLALALKEALSQKREDGGEGIMLYHPIFRRITRHTSSAILLSQMLYYYVGKCEPFYKFIRPCHHPAYKAGDSWLEALGWNYGEFSTALQKIGTKVTTGSSKTEARKTALILYWTDKSRMTYFEVVLPNIAQAILDAAKRDLSDKSVTAIYLTKLEKLLIRQVGDNNLPFIPEVFTELKQKNKEETILANQANIVQKDSDKYQNTIGKYFDLTAYDSEHGFFGNAKQHPLVKEILTFFNEDDFGETERNKLKQVISHHKDEHIYNWPITKHFIFTPGYHNFAKEVIPLLADITGNTISRVIAFLQNFTKPGGSIHHWDLWQQENPWKLKLDPEVIYAAMKEGEHEMTSRTYGYIRKDGKLSRIICS